MGHCFRADCKGRLRRPRKDPKERQEALPLRLPPESYELRRWAASTGLAALRLHRLLGWDGLGASKKPLWEPVGHGTSHPDWPQAGQTGALGSPGSSSELGTTGKGLSRNQEPGNQGWSKNRGDVASDTPHPRPMPFSFKCLTVHRNTSLCGPCPQGPSPESQPQGTGS